MDPLAVVISFTLTIVLRAMDGRSLSLTLTLFGSLATQLVLLVGRARSTTARTGTEVVSTKGLSTVLSFTFLQLYLDTNLLDLWRLYAATRRLVLPSRGTVA